MDDAERKYNEPRAAEVRKLLKSVFYKLIEHL
jgi:hypothetical protein